LAFELYLSFASLRQSASPRLAIINGKPMKRIVRTLITKRQSASPRLAKTNGNPTKRIVRILTTKSAAGSHLTYEKDQLNSRKDSNFCKTNHPGFPASVRQPPPLAKTNGKLTKRTVCTLATASAGRNPLTYEKELLNSGENSHFYKTNHPGLPHGLPPYDPDNNTFRIYAQNEIMVQFPLLLFAN
jgi:hypothetical protein